MRHKRKGVYIMIADKIENARLYPVDENVKKALEFLKNLSGNPAECGFGAKGDDVYAFYTSYDNEKNPPVFEVHKNYIDIQYIVSGKETFGWKTKPDFPEALYNPEKDCALFSEEDYGSFTLGADEFAIFYPTDAHAPKMKNAGGGKIEKIVVKVKVY